MAAASASSPCGCDLATNEDAQQTLLPFQANAAASFRMDARERLASLALALPRGVQPPGRPTDVLSQTSSAAETSLASTTSHAARLRSRVSAIERYHPHDTLDSAVQTSGLTHVDAQTRGWPHAGSATADRLTYVAHPSDRLSPRPLRLVDVSQASRQPRPPCRLTPSLADRRENGAYRSKPSEISPSALMLRARRGAWKKAEERRLESRQRELTFADPSRDAESLSQGRSNLPGRLSDLARWSRGACLPSVLGRGRVQARPRRWSSRLGRERARATVRDRRMVWSLERLGFVPSASSMA
jgi:hypothetical protein